MAGSARSRISVFGLGYVGSVTAAYLAHTGHEVWGVDTDPAKLAAFRGGASPVHEAGLDALLAEATTHGRLVASADPCAALLATDVSVVCVGTPTDADGYLDLRALHTVSQQIGSVIGLKASRHCVVFRSTVLPGTVRNVLIPILSEASGKTAHEDFDVCFNPEFLREGTALSDHHHPPFVIIGAETARGADTVASLFSSVDAPVTRTTYEVAEMLKYACNGFHALKVTFANEIGVLCKRIGIDSHEVMDLFATDDRLNISAAYLRPGFAYGGSCLGKDLRALLYLASEMEVATPVLRAIPKSNDLHVQRAIASVLSRKPKSVGLLGLSFKSGTDDVRESPALALAEGLLLAGCRVRICDPDVDSARVTGANRAALERRIPALASYLSADVDDVIETSDVVVVCKKEECFTRALRPYLGSRIVLDLVRLPLPTSDAPFAYDGICW